MYEQLYCITKDGKYIGSPFPCNMTTPPSSNSIEGTVEKWEAEDKDSYAKRQMLLKRMNILRTINECMAEWTQTCKKEWDDLNEQDVQTHASRMEWNKNNTKVANSYVPTMKIFQDRNKIGMESANEKPHWFDTVCIAAHANKMSWDAVTSGECSVELSTSGGKAVHSLYTMLSDAQKHWKPPNSPSATASRPVASKKFDWDSHAYDYATEKKDVDAKLGISQSFDPSVTSLPREYENDIQFYLRAATDNSQSSQIASVDSKPVDEKQSIEDQIAADLAGVCGTLAPSLAPSTPSLSSGITSSVTKRFSGMSMAAPMIGSTSVSKLGVGKSSSGSWWS